MRTLKMIIGIGCIIVSYIPAMPVLGGLTWGYFNSPCAFCFLVFVAVGAFLIRTRNMPISWPAKGVLALAMCIPTGFMVVIAVPDFICGYYQTAGNGCVNNLRQIDAAKSQWALENHQTNGAFVTENDLKPYIALDSHGNIPRCGIGGKYIIGRVGEDPQCRVGYSAWPNSHVLNDTNIYNWRTNFKMAYGRLLGPNRRMPTDSATADEK